MTTAPTNLARDDFDRVLTEKLWTLIPPVYRDRDGEGDNPGALRAIVSLIATQAAHLRRSHDALWDDQMIELCADWAVPYIGALLHTRMLPQLAARGARIDVSKTIYYRKRAGTPAIVEQLASDITGWEGVVAEGFRRLTRMPHGLDAPRDAAEWAGIAPQADPLLTERLNGPFDRLQHLPDIARGHGLKGRHGINRVNLNLYRLRAIPLQGVVPRPEGTVAGAFTFDPSGRDVPLMARRGRTGSVGDALDWDGWRPARPWDVPAPIPCRLLGEEVYVLTTATMELVRTLVLPADDADQLAPLIGRRLAGVGRLRTALLTCAASASFLAPAVLEEIRADALVEDCGKAQLIPRSIRVETDNAPAATMTQTRAGSLADWADPRVTGGLVIDPERGRFRFPGGVPGGRLTTDYFSGHADTIGAGGFARTMALPTDFAIRTGGDTISAAHLRQNGALRLGDSSTWGQPSNRNGIRSLNIHAAAGARPYLRLTANWTLNTPPLADAILHLDGLWIGADGPGLALALAGDWEEVRLSHVTLDPGGALTGDAGSATLPPLALEVTGTVENLIVENSITGRIGTSGNGQIEALRISDSILQDGKALWDLTDTDITMDRCTVLGAMRGRRINVSNSLFTGPVEPRDVQSGCFRFSAAPQGSTLPHPYRSHLIPPGQSLFQSQRFGDPGYARLRRHAWAPARTGGEDGQEIGAFHRLADNARLAGLRAKVSEYAPFGILPLYHFET